MIFNEGHKEEEEERKAIWTDWEQCSIINVCHLKFLFCTHGFRLWCRTTSMMMQHSILCSCSELHSTFAGLTCARIRKKRRERRRIKELMKRTKTIYGGTKKNPDGNRISQATDWKNWSSLFLCVTFLSVLSTIMIEESDPNEMMIFWATRKREKILIFLLRQMCWSTEDPAVCCQS